MQLKSTKHFNDWLRFTLLKKQLSDNNFMKFLLFSFKDRELVPGEYFIVKNEQDVDVEHFIQFSVSLRGKPAILGMCINFLVSLSNIKITLKIILNSRQRPLHCDEREQQTSPLAM